jgi:predicted DsbA family dithiol-disulfide isomerase
MNPILLYHDFVSPFCRLAVPIVIEAARRTGHTLRAVPFELHPAPGPAPPLHALEDEMAAARSAAGEWGLELGTPRHMPRTRKAHEAVAFARQRDLEIPVLRALYHAHWMEARDISRLDVLADAGAVAGLEREPLHVALGLDDLQGEVVREQDAAVAAGLTGVPAIQLGDAVAVGLVPLESLLEWIESGS